MPFKHPNATSSSSAVASGVGLKTLPTSPTSGLYESLPSRSTHSLPRDHLMRTARHASPSSSSSSSRPTSATISRAGFHRDVAAMISSITSLDGDSSDEFASSHDGSFSPGGASPDEKVIDDIVASSSPSASHAAIPEEVEEDDDDYGVITSPTAARRELGATPANSSPRPGVRLLTFRPLNPDCSHYDSAPSSVSSTPASSAPNSPRPLPKIPSHEEKKTATSNPGSVMGEAISSSNLSTFSSPDASSPDRRKSSPSASPSRGGGGGGSPSRIPRFNASRATSAAISSSPVGRGGAVAGREEGASGGGRGSHIPTSSRHGVQLLSHRSIADQAGGSGGGSRIPTRGGASGSGIGRGGPGRGGVSSRGVGRGNVTPPISSRQASSSGASSLASTTYCYRGQDAYNFH